MKADQESTEQFQLPQELVSEQDPQLTGVSPATPEPKLPPPPPKGDPEGTPQVFFSSEASPALAKLPPAVAQEALLALSRRYLGAEALARTQASIGSTDRIVLDLFKDPARRNKIHTLLTQPSTYEPTGEEIEAIRRAITPTREVPHPKRPDQTKTVKKSRGEIETEVRQEVEKKRNKIQDKFITAAEGLNWTRQEMAALDLVLRATAADYAASMGQRIVTIQAQTVRKEIQASCQLVDAGLGRQRPRFAHVEQAEAGKSSFVELPSDQQKQTIDRLMSASFNLRRSLVGDRFDINLASEINTARVSRIQEDLIQTYDHPDAKAVASTDSPLEALWQLNPRLAVEIQHRAYDVALRREAGDITEAIIKERVGEERGVRQRMLDQAEERIKDMEEGKAEYTYDETQAKPDEHGLADDHERLHELYQEMQQAEEGIKTKEEFVRSKQEEINRLEDATAGEIKGADEALQDLTTEMGNYQARIRQAATGEERQAILEESRTLTPSITSARERLRELQRDLRNLKNTVTQANRELTELKDRLAYLELLNIQPSTEPPDEQQIARASQILKLCRDINTPEGLSQFLATVLTGREGTVTRENALVSVDNLRQLIGLDKQTLTNQQLRHVIASALGHTIEDIDEIAEPGRIADAVDLDRQLLSQLAANNPYDFVDVLITSLDNRLQAVAQGDPSVFIEIKPRTTRLEFAQLAEPARETLHRQDFVEGVNCLRFSQGVDIDTSHYEIISQNGETKVYQTTVDASGKPSLKELGSLGIVQQGGNYRLAGATPDVISIRDRLLKQMWLEALLSQKRRADASYFIIENQGTPNERRRQVDIDAQGNIYIQGAGIGVLRKLFGKFEGEKLSRALELLNFRGTEFRNLPLLSKTITKGSLAEILSQLKRSVKSIPLQAYLEAHPHAFDQYIVNKVGSNLLDPTLGQEKRSAELTDAEDLIRRKSGAVTKEDFEIMNDGEIKLTWRDPKNTTRCRLTINSNGRINGKFEISTSKTSIRSQEMADFLQGDVNIHPSHEQQAVNAFRDVLPLAIADRFLEMPPEKRRQFAVSSFSLEVWQPDGSVITHEVSMDSDGFLYIQDTRHPNNSKVELTQFLNEGWKGNYTMWLRQNLDLIKEGLGEEFLKSLTHPRRP